MVLFSDFLKKAPPGFEPGIEVLQTFALPLGYGATKMYSYSILYFYKFVNSSS